MRVCFKPDFVMGEVTVIRKNDDGTFLPRPMYHFVADDGNEVLSYDYNVFEVCPCINQ